MWLGLGTLWLEVNMNINGALAVVYTEMGGCMSFFQ